VQEGIKSGNVSETCRRQGIAPNLFYRWKDEAKQGAKAALGGGGEKRCRGRNREGPSHPAVGENAGAEVAGDRNPKKRRGGVSCGAVHSQAREMMTQGYAATWIAATLAISRSSLYYRKKPRGSRADRQYDEQTVVACGEKPAYGYRRVTWWVAKKRKPSAESQTCPAGDERTWVAGALASSAGSQEERVGPCGSSRAEPDLAAGHDKDLGGTGSGLGVSGMRDRLLHARGRRDSSRSLDYSTTTSAVILG
jgi:hypothetical protein